MPGLCLAELSAFRCNARKAQGKGAASTRVADDVDFSAVQFHQFAADGKPKAGAAMRPRYRAVNLPELLKDMRQVLGGNTATGIGNDDRGISGILLAGYANASGIGEFYRIADDVDQDLAQSQRIGPDGDRLGEMVDPDPLLVSLMGKLLDAIGDCGRQIHRLGVDVQHAILNLGHVKRIMHQFRQMRGRGFHPAGKGLPHYEIC